MTHAEADEKVPEVVADSLPVRVAERLGTLTLQAGNRLHRVPESLMPGIQNAGGPLRLRTACFVIFIAAVLHLVVLSIALPRITFHQYVPTAAVAAAAFAVIRHSEGVYGIWRQRRNSQ